MKVRIIKSTHSGVNPGAIGEAVRSGEGYAVTLPTRHYSGAGDDKVTLTTVYFDPSSVELLPE